MTGKVFKKPQSASCDTESVSVPTVPPTLTDTRATRERSFKDLNRIAAPRVCMTPLSARHCQHVVSTSKHKLKWNGFSGGFWGAVGRIDCDFCEGGCTKTASRRRGIAIAVLAYGWIAAAAARLHSKSTRADFLFDQSHVGTRTH